MLLIGSEHKGSQDSTTKDSQKRTSGAASESSQNVGIGVFEVRGGISEGISSSESLT